MKLQSSSTSGLWMLETVFPYCWCTLGVYNKVETKKRLLRGGMIPWMSSRLRTPSKTSVVRSFSLNTVQIRGISQGRPLWSPTGGHKARPYSAWQSGSKGTS